MGPSSKNPGDRIGEIKAKQGTLILKNGKNPKYPESTSAGKGDNHGQDGVSQPTYAAGKYVHYPAEKIRSADYR